MDIEQPTIIQGEHVEIVGSMIVMLDKCAQKSIATLTDHSILAGNPYLGLEVDLVPLISASPLTKGKLSNDDELLIVPFNGFAGST